MTSTRTPEDYEKRDLSILRYAADYGIVLQAVISTLLFAGKQCGHIIRRLSDFGDLELFPRALPGSISYARLTKSGCARLGVSERLSEPLSGHALSQAVAISCYCVLGSQRRIRLTHADMKSLFSDNCPHPNIPHVLLSKEELSDYALLRVVFAGGSNQETKKQISRLVDEASKNPVLSHAMQPKASYGFLLLCPTKARKNALEEALANSDSLCDELIVADVGPGVEELPGYLKSSKGTTQ